MAAKSAAQEEFDSIIQKASAGNELSHHPDDEEDYKHDREHSDREEEEEYIQQQVDENMRMPALDRVGGGSLRLPPRDFDRGRTTGVKGVIADARSYEEARKSGSRRSKQSPGTGGNRADRRASTATFLIDDGEGSASEDEEFLERWREQRRMELQREGSDIRNRRTSPSVRRYGRFDEVDALGYLDAIEKVGRDTVVVVFVYDHEVFPPCYPLLKQVLTLPVCRLTSHLRCPDTSRCISPQYSLRPSPLRRYRVRQRRCPCHSRLQESRRPLCKPHLHHRPDSRRQYI
jgi:hypothetical protein